MTDTEPLFGLPEPSTAPVGHANGQEDTRRIDLAAVMAATRPAVVIYVNAADMRPENLTAAELSDAGRLLGLKPSELMATLGDRDSWEAVDFGYVVAWLVLRRQDPTLAYATVRTYTFETTPDPTRPAATPAPLGTAGRSNSRALRASRRPTSDV